MAPKTSPPRWECACCDDVHNDYTSICIDDDTVCTTCIKELLDKALVHEFHWPAKWCSIVLHPKHFSHIISSDFISRYEVREREYNCEHHRRGYCNRGKGEGPSRSPCGAFIGRLHHGEDPSFYAASSCSSCTQLHCLNCGYDMKDLGELGSHDCASRICAAKEKDKQENEDAFAGLKQGKDFQICPNESCKCLVELSEACNHVICAYCSMSFCFVCGTPQSEHGRHWHRGGCPRYHFPGEPGARFDDQPSSAGSVAGGGRGDNRSRRGSDGGWGHAPASLNGSDDGRIAEAEHAMDADIRSIPSRPSSPRNVDIEIPIRHLLLGPEP